MNSYQELRKPYLLTLERFDIDTIPSHLYLKKPQMNIFLLSLTGYDSKQWILEEVEDYIKKQDEHQELSKQEIYSWVLYHILLSKQEKKQLFEKIKQNDISSLTFLPYLLQWMTCYFQFYMLFQEIFYIEQDSLNEDIECILEQKDSKIKKRLKLYMKKDKMKMTQFLHFYNHLQELEEMYIHWTQLCFHQMNLENQEKWKYRFYQFIFSPWYVNYKVRVPQSSSSSKYSWFSFSCS